MKEGQRRPDVKYRIRIASAGDIGDMNSNIVCYKESGLRYERRTLETRR